MSQALLIDTSTSPGAAIRSVPIDRISLIHGYWQERFLVNQDTSLRELWELLADPEAGHVLSNFRIAGATEDGEYGGTDWQDAWLYKWIEAAAVIFKLTGDEWIEARMREAIDLIAKAQADDGYLATQVLSRNGVRFDDPRKHEVYTMGHLLTAGVIHRRMTGSEALYELALRVGAYLHSVLGRSVSPSFAHNPSAVMGLVELYRESGQQIYLETATTIIESRGKEPAQPGKDLWHAPGGILGTDQIQDRTPLREAASVVGHNVFFTYLFAGAADLHLETGDNSLWEPLVRLWSDLVNKKMSVNGGVSPMGHGLSENNDLVVEAVGKPYFLPHEDSYNETCGQVGNLLWNFRMLCARPDGRFADMMEHEIYNGVLSGVDLAGENYWYRNQLRFHADHVPSGHNDLVERVKPGRDRICCPTNVVRTIAEWRGYLFGTDDEGVWLHHYAACSATIPIAGGGDLSVTVEASYPWDGDVTLRLDASTDREVRVVLRIPAWASGAGVRVNGDAVEPTQVASGYVGVTRLWKEQDEITLSLPMRVRLIEANPYVEQCRNQVAVMRGPILYCLESADLPEGVELDDVLIPSDIQLTPEPNGMPFGTRALSGQALVRLGGNQTDGLYRELRSDGLSETTVRLIPYFAWANRGRNSMSVWLPLHLR